MVPRILRFPPRRNNLRRAQQTAVAFNGANTELTFERKLGLKSIQYIFDGCHACFGGLL